MESSLWTVSGCVMLGTLLLSCASPKVRILENPVPGSPNAERNEFRRTSRKVLGRDGLAGLYRKDPYAALRSLSQLLERDGGDDRLFALAELCGTLGGKRAAKDPAAAAGCYLDAARLARPAALRMAASGTDHNLLLVHNEACALLASLLKKENWRFPARFVGPLHSYHLSLGHAADAPIEWNDYSEFVVADRIELRHAELKVRHRTGVGGAIVAHQPMRAVTGPDRQFAGTNGFVLPVNAMLEFHGTGERVDLVLRNMLKADRIRAGGRSVPLAANWSASQAYLYQYTPSPKTTLARMLRSADYDSLNFLYELAPFDPDKIPVVFVHGLASSPAIWIRMINQLRIDPVLRKNYQAVVFRYPTGYPIPRNAASMHAKLANYRKANKSARSRGKLRRMVLIGHSMGGILTNIEVRDSGESIRKVFCAWPIKQLRLPPDKEDALRRLLYFESNPDVERVIFIATPHRGSGIALNAIGGFGSSLIKLPWNFMNIGLSLDDLKQLPGLTEYGRDRLKARPDSIKGLRPDSDYLKTILKLPFGNRVTCHTIVGQVNRNRHCTEGTDTVVRYWSSHLDSAASEKIVNSGHTTITAHSDTLEEIRRLLHLHLGRETPPPLDMPGTPARPATPPDKETRNHAETTDYEHENNEQKNNRASRRRMDRNRMLCRPAAAGRHR